MPPPVAATCARRGAGPPLSAMPAFLMLLSSPASMGRPACFDFNQPSLGSQPEFARTTCCTPRTPRCRARANVRLAHDAHLMAPRSQPPARGAPCSLRRAAPGPVGGALTEPQGLPPWHLAPWVWAHEAARPLRAAPRAAAAAPQMALLLNQRQHSPGCRRTARSTPTPPPPTHPPCPLLTRQTSELAAVRPLKRAQCTRARAAGARPNAGSGLPCAEPASRAHAPGR
ncbi:MAG: hypothetical protein J3K34DRAFT_17909 [Monoraphidium minutum]|nr:MAG: hypothetical protein J3K34DRAFT_17909 [Monoraphidium minutum]